MTFLYKLLMSVVIVYVAIGAVLYVMQRSFIYFPTPDVAHEFETLQFDAGDATLNLVLVNPVQRDAILYFGGNAEVVAQNGADFRDAFAGHSTYLVNYRGYGGSTGEPSEAALFADALKLYDQLAPLYNSLTVVGRSLGSGVATYLASERPVSRLVLITPFDSIQALASARFPVYPMSLLLHDAYHSAARASSVNAEVLVMVAGRDEIVPRTNTDALIDALAPVTPKVAVFEEAGHNDISLHPRYQATLSAFVGR